MDRQRGFTIIELMVTLAIVGILFATAVPIYHTWQQRAYGSEAAIMLRQIINGEIAYLLENDHFFPKDNTYSIYHKEDPVPATAITEIEEALKITIPKGHFIEYDLTGGDDFFTVVITSYNWSFEIFKDARQIYATVDKKGNTNIYYAEYE